LRGSKRDLKVKNKKGGNAKKSGSVEKFIFVKGPPQPKDLGQTRGGSTQQGGGRDLKRRDEEGGRKPKRNIASPGVCGFKGEPTITKGEEGNKGTGGEGESSGGKKKEEENDNC